MIKKIEEKELDYRLLILFVLNLFFWLVLILLQTKISVITLIFFIIIGIIIRFIQYFIIVIFKVAEGGIFTVSLIIICSVLFWLYNNEIFLFILYGYFMFALFSEHIVKFFGDKNLVDFLKEDLLNEMVGKEEKEDKCKDCNKLKRRNENEK